MWLSNTENQGLGSSTLLTEADMFVGDSRDWDRLEQHAVRSLMKSVVTM